MNQLIAAFAGGALFSLMLCGWPWHHRFSRYSRSSRYRAGEDSNGNCVPLPPAPPPPVGYKRLVLPPPDVMEAINRQLDRDIAAEVARRRAAAPPMLTEGRIQRGNGNGGPSTGKPVIQPQSTGNAVKPPPGLTPRFIADEARLREVADAINRYREAGMRVPFKWLFEYHQLCRKVEAAGVFNAPAIRAAAADEKPQPYGNPNPPPSAP
jgi:hypothetical protein